MQFETRQGKILKLGIFSLANTSDVSRYWELLSEESRQRFSPHGFNEEDILQTYQHPSSAIGFIAREISTHQIIAYSIIRLNIPKHEATRFLSYGTDITIHDALFAPSVADSWQGTGVGTIMLNYIKGFLEKWGIKRLFLWGGVQLSNERARLYYSKQGFRHLGFFEYNGLNEDMVLEL